MCAPPLPFQNKEPAALCALLSGFSKTPYHLAMCAPLRLLKNHNMMRTCALFPGSSLNLQDDSGMCASFPPFPKSIPRIYMCGLVGAKESQKIIYLDTCLNTKPHSHSWNGVLLLLYQKMYMWCL